MSERPITPHRTTAEIIHIFTPNRGLAGISGLVGVAAVVLLCSGRLPEGIYTGVGGGMYSNATAICLKLANDTNDRVDKDVRALEEQSYLPVETLRKSCDCSSRKTK